ncbi:MAG: hypothetical protein HQL71_15125 [Magnetococcales bacterium]|nr:hypothetical protein [Magnetococcales bacterium]
MQVLNTTSGQIMTTFYLKSSFATKERRVDIRMQGESHRGPPNSKFFSKLAKKAAANMADQLVDAVFPMKVMAVRGDRLYINRGQDGGLLDGELLNIYMPGVLLIDPDTGENLGTAEEYVGQGKIMRINPKFTIVKLLENDSGLSVEVGSIVRKP